MNPQIAHQFEYRERVIDDQAPRTDTPSSQPSVPRTVITVETNEGGHILLEQVRARLADLPVIVRATTRTRPEGTRS